MREGMMADQTSWPFAQNIANGNCRSEAWSHLLGVPSEVHSSSLLNTQDWSHRRKPSVDDEAFSDEGNDGDNVSTNVNPTRPTTSGSEDYRRAALDFVLELAGPQPQTPSADRIFLSHATVPVDDIPTPAFAVGRDMRCSFWNSRMAETSGWSELEVVEMEDFSSKLFLVPTAPHSSHGGFAPRAYQDSFGPAVEPCLVCPASKEHPGNGRSMSSALLHVMHGMGEISGEPFLLRCKDGGRKAVRLHAAQRADVASSGGFSGGVMCLMVKMEEEEGEGAGPGLSDLLATPLQAARGGPDSWGLGTAAAGVRRGGGCNFSRGSEEDLAHSPRGLETLGSPTSAADRRWVLEHDASPSGPSSSPCAVISKRLVPDGSKQDDGDAALHPASHRDDTAHATVATTVASVSSLPSSASPSSSGIFDLAWPSTPKSYESALAAGGVSPFRLSSSCLSNCSSSSHNSQCRNLAPSSRSSFSSIRSLSSSPRLGPSSPPPSQDSRLSSSASFSCVADAVSATVNSSSLSSFSLPTPCALLAESPCSPSLDELAMHLERCGISSSSVSSPEDAVWRYRFEVRRQMQQQQRSTEGTGKQKRRSSRRSRSVQGLMSNLAWLQEEEGEQEKAECLEQQLQQQEEEEMGMEDSWIEHCLAEPRHNAATRGTAPTFSLVVMHLQAASKDGYAAVRELRQLEKHLSPQSNSSALGQKTQSSLPKEKGEEQEGGHEVTAVTKKEAPTTTTDLCPGKSSSAHPTQPSDSPALQQPALAPVYPASLTPPPLLILGVANLNRWDLAGMDSCMDACISAGVDAVIPHNITMQQLRRVLQRLGVRSKYLDLPASLPRALSGSVHNPLNLSR